MYMDDHIPHGGVLRTVADAPADVQMRLDAGAILKRFHFLERALLIAAAGWIPATRTLEVKALLARTSWTGSLTGHELRERVFELRFPSRLVEIGDDAPLVELFEASAHAPSGPALLDALGERFLPALADAYERYLAASDELADAPTRRTSGTCRTRCAATAWTAL